MKVLKTEDILFFWKSGVSLEQAILHFATPEGKAKYNALYQKKDTEFHQNLNTLSTPPDKKHGTEIWQNIGKMLTALSTGGGIEFTGHIESLKKEVIRYVRDGWLIALGYPMPRQAADPPQIIPDDVWVGKIDWQKSEIKGNGLHFVSVRISIYRTSKGCVLEHAPQQPETIQLIAAPTPRIGRPSYKRVIKEAYDYLKSQNLIDHEHPMTACYPLIRDYLAKAYPARAGQYLDMANEAIRPVISPLYKEFKKK